MTWENRGDRRAELRADPGIAPGSRNIDPPKRRRSIWPSIAVVAAFAAFGGVIWFAYQSGRGDGSGVPPLVKADTRPLKTKPDNPGGAEIPFQDSTVYDRLNQNGQKPVVEHLLPGPETPVTRPPAGTPPADSAIDPPLVDTPPVIAHAPPQAPLPQTLAPQTLPPGVPGAPIADTGSPTVLAPSPGAIITQPPATAPHTAPVAKPATTPPAPAAKTPTAPPSSIASLIAGAGTAAPAAPKASAGGSYRLQLSAVRSADAVAEEWGRLKHRYPELAALKSFSNKVEVAGKGTFYRVEAGPLDEADAKSTCAHLRGQGLGCIVVKR
jgi:hypothetical protein